LKKYSNVLPVGARVLVGMDSMPSIFMMKHYKFSDFGAGVAKQHMP